MQNNPPGGVPHVAALPFKYAKENGVAFLLVGPRDGGGWSIPKGDPTRRSRPHESAAHHAFEQAGVAGWIRETPIGFYTHSNESAAQAEHWTIGVYLLEVDGQVQTWPKQDHHRIGWFGTCEAAELIDEEGLCTIIRGLTADGLRKLLNEERLRNAIGRELRSRHQPDSMMPAAMVSLLANLDRRQHP